MDPIVSVVVFGFLINLVGGFRKELSDRCPNGVPVLICSYMHGNGLFVLDIIRKWKSKPIGASIIQKSSPIARKMLFLSLYFANRPTWMSRAWSDGNSKFLSSFDTIYVKKGCFSIVYFRLGNSKRKDPFSIRFPSSISDRMDHQEAQEGLNY